MLPSVFAFDVQEPSSVVSAGRLDAERQGIYRLQSAIGVSFVVLAVLMWWSLQALMPGHGFIWGLLVLFLLFALFREPYQSLRVLNDLYTELGQKESMRASELSDEHRTLEKYRLAVLEARKLVRGDLKAMEAFAVANGLI